MMNLHATGLGSLQNYLAAVTTRSAFLTSALPSVQDLSFLSQACFRNSLSELGRGLRADHPQERMNALHALAASDDRTRNDLAACLKETDVRALDTQTSRYVGALPANPLKFLFLGDIHDAWGPVRKIVQHECRTGSEVVLGVGDLETYKSINAKIPFVFAHGNHEDEKAMAAIRNSGETAWGTPHPLYAGEFGFLRGGLTFAAFSGIYQQDHFESGADGIFPFFSQADVARMKDIPFPIDIFLAHEAPAGVGFTRDGRDLGSTVVADVLQRLQPKVAFFGHHHRGAFDGHLGDTRVIGLDYPKISYVTATFDPADGELRFERHRANVVENKGTKEYHYDWEANPPQRIHSLGMPTVMKRENEAAEMLDRTYRSALVERLVPTLLPTVGQPTDTEKTKRLLAEGLANGVFNTILPYFARYYVSLKASLSEREKNQLRESSVREMLRDKQSIAFAHADLAAAFDELASLVAPK